MAEVYVKVAQEEYEEDKDPEAFKLRISKELYRSNPWIPCIRMGRRLDGSLDFCGDPSGVRPNRFPIFVYNTS
jgi:hypothetical protein